MGRQIPTTTSFNLPDGREVSIETGKLATQADGSVVVKVGQTMIFASVVSAYSMREGQSFFPLSVDYQEKFSAAGRIPGNFFRRETKLSDYEVLISRLVDRAIRPLFPDHYMYETQVILTLLSGEVEELPDAYTALAASAALMVSDIPFGGPISEVRVARIGEKFHINPSRSALAGADIDLIVAADMNNIMMVEGEAKECSEKDLVAAIKVAHEAIKVQCEAQLALRAKVGDIKVREIAPLPENDELKTWVKMAITEKVAGVALSFLDKKSRKNKLSEIREETNAALLAAKGEEYVAENKDIYDRYFEKFKKESIRNVVLEKRVRLDGRKTDEVRPIWTEIDYLPSTHGSAIFNRGETQALASMTLGTKLDKQMIDTALENGYENFILHYNFPAFSVGEAKPMRGPGRREVGHANLAARSLKQVMPKDFPYTVRIVSDILESNGSSSMATVCAGSLALMDGGVNLKAPVSGIAMGMISDGTRHAILTDILGDEDALGDMDFKVTGTENGITACQMDIKIEGLSYELLEEALLQAKIGRIHILGKMAETIDRPRRDMKPHAPRIVELRIDKSFIGAVIGPGGKVIQDIQATTGSIINIEEVGDEGIVSVSSSNKASIDAALERITDITFKPAVGDTYEAKVVTVMPYGVFVDFKGKSGLVHVSELSHTRIDSVGDHLKEGDSFKVKLIGLDPKTGKFRLSRKALMKRPEGMVADDRGDRDDRGDDRRGGGRDDRRGGGGGRDDRRGGGGGRR